MHSRRLSLGVAAWLLVSCAPALGVDELVVREPGSDEALMMLPDAHAPSVSDGVQAESPTTTGRVACLDLLGDAEGQVRDDLTAICSAGGHDQSCVGFLCTRTAPREGLECLLHAGEADRVIALEIAAEPAARSMAREVIERRDAWTLERIEAAMLDEASVTSCGGCTCSALALSHAGLRAARYSGDPNVVGG